MSGLNYNPMVFALSKVQGAELHRILRIRPSKAFFFLRLLSLSMTLYAGTLLGRTETEGDPGDIIYFCNMIGMEWPAVKTTNLSFNIVDIRLDERLREIPSKVSINIKCFNPLENFDWEWAPGGDVPETDVLIQKAEGATLVEVDLTKLNSQSARPLLRLACFQDGQPISARYAARYGIVITINIECRTTTFSEEKTVRFESNLPNIIVDVEQIEHQHSPRMLIVNDMLGHTVARYYSGDPLREQETLALLPSGLYMIVDPSIEDRIPTRKVRKL